MINTNKRNLYPNPNKSWSLHVDFNGKKFKMINRSYAHIVETPLLKVNILNVKSKKIIIVKRNVKHNYELNLMKKIKIPRKLRFNING